MAGQHGVRRLADVMARTGQGEAYSRDRKEQASGQQPGVFAMTLSDHAKLAFDAEYFLLRVAAVEQPEATNKEDLLRLYDEHYWYRRFSPNPLVDETWYLTYYPDVLETLQRTGVGSGFEHFCDFGVYEGRMPNPSFWWRSRRISRPHAEVSSDQFQPGRYLAAFPEAEAIVVAFPWLTPLVVFNKLGRLLGHRPDQTVDPVAVIAPHFDSTYYKSVYHLSHLTDAEAFDHYVKVGIPRKYSPCVGFDEEWYQAFYQDIREAVHQREFLCGFQHYILFGKREMRFGSRQLQEGDVGPAPEPDGVRGGVRVRRSIRVGRVAERPSGLPADQGVEPRPDGPTEARSPFASAEPGGVGTRSGGWARYGRPPAS